jgi:excinuclease ABC A subunit
VPGYETITGFEYIDGIFEVRQEPIGRKNNSIPLTYLGIWNKIRALFAGTEQAGKKGFTAGFFSFNSRGACSSCRGNGYLRRWLGDIIIESDCPECSGNRYRQEILEITYRGKNIHDILSMSFAEAAGFFKQTPSIHRMIRVVNKTGLDYLVLGQSLMSLSGGELQRIKLAKELIRKPAGSVLYVFDEPTTGLSYDDINTLLGIFDELLCNGNSIIIIEHDPVVLAYCDYIIELGPGSGDKGGRIIAQGSPGELRENPHSVTGPFLYNRNKDRV